MALKLGALQGVSMWAACRRLESEGLNLLQRGTCSHDGGVVLPHSAPCETIRDFGQACRDRPLRGIQSPGSINARQGTGSLM